MRFELQRIAILCDGSYHLLRHAFLEFGLDLEGHPYLGADEPVEVRHDLFGDLAGVTPDADWVERDGAVVALVSTCCWCNGWNAGGGRRAAIASHGFRCGVPGRVGGIRWLRDHWGGLLLGVELLDGGLGPHEYAAVGVGDVDVATDLEASVSLSFFIEAFRVGEAVAFPGDEADARADGVGEHRG